MATATASTTESRSSSSTGKSSLMKVAMPYLIAIGAQLPMFLLFFRQMMSKTHYQTVWLALIATAAIAWSRWPREERIPFRESTASNILLGLGLIMGIGSVLFVDTWFCAASVMLLITSFLLKVADSDRSHSLWTAALPLFVFLPIPFGRDTTLITGLQLQSARLTSSLLDLLGLGHFLDGTQIHVPGKAGYGIEEACSGVQSFFTLLFIAVVMMVVFRRIKTNLAGGSVLAMLGIVFLAASIALPFMFYLGIAFILWGLLGFRAMAIVAAAVFWAMFINVLRILLIPILDVNGVADLTGGFGHILLGWGALAIGLALLLSTDQLLLFLFGPVDTEMGELGPFGKLITKFWNQLVSGQEVDTEKKKKRKILPVTAKSTRLAWIVAGILGVGGLLQLGDVALGFSEAKTVQVFDADVTFPMTEDDLPKQLENWARFEQNGYMTRTRDHGSDLGRRSDIWQYRAPNCNAIISLDQTFPGWHELTTCYRNSGWNLSERVVIQPEVAEGEENWDIVEASYQKSNGKSAYLLFSLFNGAGEPEDAPVNVGTFKSFLERVKNRLSNRVRRSLFSSETYQVQVFIEHYGELDAATKDEIKTRYLQAREALRQKFVSRVEAKE
jgi:exosortase